MEEKSKQIMRLMERRFDPNDPYYIEKEDFEVVPAKGTYGLRVLDNCPLPLSSINMKNIKNLKIRPDDVFICGYPKSGTTYIEEITWLLVNNLDYDQSKNSFHYVDRVTFLDECISEAEANDLKSPRVMKTHFLKQFLPEDFHLKAKVVYILRNPKDVVVSLYKFMSNITTEEGFVGDFEDMVELFLSGKYMYGGWWETVDQYVNLPNVHVVHYETLLKDPFGEIGKLAKYLGKEISDDELRALVAYTSFESMSKIPSMDPYQVYPDVKSGSTFYPTGKAGNWKKYFSKEMSDRFDRVIESNLKYEKKIDYGDVVNKKAEEK